MAQINKPSEYFNTKLYTGDGNVSRSITGVGFQPDWVWIKDRDTPYYHGLWDSVRTTKGVIYSNATDAEDTTAAGTLTSFDSDGFTLPSSGLFVNDNNDNIVSWNWKANGTGVSNTDGSITSTVSVNTTSGFSIVEYTGTGVNATVGHGLGVTPAMMIVKRTELSGGSWRVYNKSLSATSYLLLETIAASASQANLWNNTEPTSSVFTIGTAGDVNLSSYKHIAYVFAEKKGYSKIGSYTGNGNVDGTFVYTGFKPALLIRKRTDASNDWYINDNKRAGYNPQNDYLFPNSTQTESALQRFDFLSNGFKIRTTDTGDNASGGTYIYMAFAENPLVGTNNIPATAR